MYDGQYAVVEVDELVGGHCPPEESVRALPASWVHVRYLMEGKRCDGDGSGLMEDNGGGTMEKGSGSPELSPTGRNVTTDTVTSRYNYSDFLEHIRDGLIFGSGPLGAEKGAETASLFTST
ncbi:hypothetical protein EVAR_10762_1 [Eumeta japonica]|uniref:Uncharacterized protein n=1 Tax=Eumeta variegata TaxID=151549 RepID=A0A4C1W9H7_EUMVA|nr:hypothetical protein EVAR_10762_1 [Eumeta japonica]